MTDEHTQPADSSEPIELTEIGSYIRARREALGISQRELMRRSGVANVPRLEMGATTRPRTDSLQAIADVLGVSLTELVAAGRPEELPTLTPYLRTKYGQMPDAALDELQKYLAKLTAKHGLTADAFNGPKPGEDEQDE